MYKLNSFDNSFDYTWKLDYSGIIVLSTRGMAGCDLERSGTATASRLSEATRKRRQTRGGVITVLKTTFGILPRAQVRPVIMTPTKITGAPATRHGPAYISLNAVSLIATCFPLVLPVFSYFYFFPLSFKPILI